MATKSELTWTEIDPETLPAAQAAAYAEYKALYRKMKACREAFEASFQSAAPEGKRFVFGYNFGRLSIAVADDDKRARKSAQPKASLADYLAAQAASGRRA